MSMPSLEEARRLADWRPPLGVVSVYLRIDPDDRGGGWRTELANGVSAVQDRAAELDHEAAGALRATCARVLERFSNHDLDLPRAEIGFLEVAAKNGQGSWWSSHVQPAAPPTATFDESPVVAPLVCLLGRGTARGAALLSAERVKLIEWAPGHLEELVSWELSIFSRDWRERKAQRVADPARGQAVSASGRDQFDERLEESRRRFLGECGRLAVGRAAERRWRSLLLFGSTEHARDFQQGGAPNGLRIEQGAEADLIAEPLGMLETPIAQAAERLDAERDAALVEKVLEATRGGIRGSVGAQETEAALAEARVETLVLDCGVSASRETMVRSALQSGAQVAAVSGEAAEKLASGDGVAALLRY
jgi:hypothetical protein